MTFYSNTFCTTIVTQPIIKKKILYIYIYIYNIFHAAHWSTAAQFREKIFFHSDSKFYFTILEQYTITILHVILSL